MEIGDCAGQRLGIEIRPHRVAEPQLGIGAFPQQEVGQALLAAGADQEIDRAGGGIAGKRVGNELADEIER
jgi:hypothetical protein